VLLHGGHVALVQIEQATVDLTREEFAADAHQPAALGGHAIT
jgi:hypothetical protein